MRTWHRHVIVLPKPETPSNLWTAAQRVGVIIISTGQSSKSQKEMHKAGMHDEKHARDKMGHLEARSRRQTLRPIVVPFPTFSRPPSDQYHIKPSQVLCEDQDGMVSYILKRWTSLPFQCRNKEYLFR